MFGTRSSSQLTALAASRVSRAGNICTVTLTDDGFGALMWKKPAQSHRFGLGGVGRGDTIGGGGRRTENRDHIYIYIHTHYGMLCTM